MKLINFLNAIQKFYGNIQDSIIHSFAMFLLYIVFWSIVVLGVLAYAVTHPTAETAYIAGGIIIARVVYAGLTGK